MTFNSSTFNTTYKDDYSDSAGFYRILFNGGKYLQPRELTQMQTILDKQIARMGQNIFKEGAAVNPGGMVVNNRYEFIKLASGAVLPATLSDLVGTEYTGGTSGVKVKVLEVVAATGSDPDTLYVVYTDTSTGTAGATPIRMSAGESMTNGTYAVTVQSTNTVGNPAIGTGTRVSVYKGEFFVQGYFVFAPGQSLIVSKYSSTPTLDVGFKVVESIVTEATDISLYDNSNDIPNLSAQGAHRYKIDLQISARDDIDSDENFVYVGRITSGAIADIVKAVDDYNIINDLLALRTKEESGNYIVKPFKVKFDDNDSDATLLDIDISKGVAYVDGYRAENKFPITIETDRARTTTTENNEVVAANFGSYVIINAFKGISELDILEEHNLRSDSAHAGSTIGTARVRSIEEDGANWRLYLFKIEMNSGSSFRNVKSIGESTSNYYNIELENSKAVLKGNTDNNLLWPLPNTRPSSVSDISLTTQRYFSTTTNGSGAATLTLTAPGETFADTNAWIMANNDSDAHLTATVSGSGTASASIAGGPISSTAFEIAAYINKSAGTSRSKTLGETTVTGTIESDGNGVAFFDLSDADVYAVSRLRAIDSDGEDYTNRFIFDDGQRDNYYAQSRMILRSGQTPPAGNIFARYTRFTHGTSGDFFSVNSYSGQVDYEDIQSYQKDDGEVVSLRDVLDFRPISHGSTANYSGASARVNELPKNTDLISADVVYYLPRRDKIVINIDGAISVVTGVPAINPQYPTTPGNALEIYKIHMNPYTLNDSDIDLEFIETKGYTMADIGKIEKRVETLEEFTTLSLLELDTQNWAVLDSAGLDRTKSGFFVDNFSDHYFSATTNAEFRAAIDPQRRIMRPSFSPDNIRLMYDSDLSSNTVIKGDNVYLKYTEVSFIDQDLASGVDNINPFAVITHLGALELSPASDDWKEVRYNTPRIIDGGTRLNTNQAFNWNEWEWNWAGTPVNDLQIGSTSTSTSGTNRVTSSETIREVVGERIVDVALLPFIRSKKVFFRAQGIRPNTRMFPYFDGTRVDAWVREEAFTRFSATNTDFGNLHDNSTAHPSGSSTLISNTEGTIEGSFFVPNTPALKFRAGTRELKFLDISSGLDSDALSRTSAYYTAQGVIETREEDIVSTRVLGVTGAAAPPPRNEQPFENGRVGRSWTGDGRGRDPLAQSFRVENIHGIFATKIDVYFSTKDDVVPVQMELRPMVNGSPSSASVIPGSVKFLPPASVSTSTTGATATTFEFDEPVFLAPFTEYAIVLLAETIEYNVYTAEINQFLVGSTELRVSRQPSMGSLFKSQNGSTWEPDQTKDLKFKIYRADFDTAGGFMIMENVNVPNRLLVPDPFETDSGGTTITTFHPGHGFLVGDNVNITGVDSADTIGGIAGTSFLGDRTVIAIDGNGYTFAADSSATSSSIDGGATVTATRNIPFDIAFPQVQTLLPRDTNIAAEAKFTTSASLAGDETGYQKDASYANVILGGSNMFAAPRMIANAGLETAELSGARSTSFKLSMTSFNSRVSPVVDMQRASLTTISNLIDQQDSAATSGFNVPLNWVAETAAEGGTHLAKHLTKQVFLEEDAVGLKILISANRPSVADFDVYYRVGNEGVNLTDVAWTLVPKESNIPSDENSTVYRQYEYLVGGKGGSIEAFAAFQTKIVMISTNSSKVPVLKDLRIIALGV